MLKQLSERFVAFAEKECKGSSVLYEFLALAISRDSELLNICTNACNSVLYLIKLKSH